LWQYLIKQEIEKHQDRKQRYQELRKQLKETSGNQISTSDPESRHMITRNNITEVAYNIQTTVDADNNIPIDYKVTNENDSKAMGKMLRRAKVIVGDNKFTALYDKGYHTGSEFKAAADLGIEVLVATPGVAANAPNPDYNVEHFIYDNEKISTSARTVSIFTVMAIGIKVVMPYFVSLKLRLVKVAPYAVTVPKPGKMAK
jgi:hypothetical protein